MVTKRLQRLLKLWLDQIYGLNIAIINGETAAVAKKSEGMASKSDEMTRKRLITAFEAQSGFNLLIMSLVAAGVGLTVVGANHVVHLERHWNPGKEAQASDRPHPQKLLQIRCTAAFAARRSNSSASNEPPTHSSA